MSTGRGPAGFPDHFSAHAEHYRRFRPGYPAALFRWLADQAPARRLAWDCGTGNGQAAVGLSAFFDRVVATDASARQLHAARRHPGVGFVVCRAEQACLADGSAQLITAAQAAHWFEPTAFHREVARVGGARAVVAVWAYGLLRVDPPIDALIDRYYADTLGSYWPPERRHIDARYRSLRFPFDELAAPSLQMSAHWNLDQLAGYLGSWSATRRYRQAEGEDPLPELTARLAAAWGPSEDAREIRWPLYLRAGRLVH